VITVGLLEVVAQVVGAVALLATGAAWFVVGPDRLRRARDRLPANARAVAPSLIVLGTVLALNGVVRDIGVELSWIIGVNITGYIYALEGQLVVALQSLRTPPLTAYFAFVYVVGYAFLLSFPVVAYLVHATPRPLYETAVAYAINYGVGLVCYVAFVAYGPRNFMPELIESLLYTGWPQVQLLTSQVNVNTNVFPSLHASLSATVALLAYRHRDAYPRWLAPATFLALSIAVSTMYLGIHWATDVVAGFGLAALSVSVAARTSGPTARDRFPGTSAMAVGEWLRPGRGRDD